MADDREPLHERLREALAEHIQAWRFSGVEWLPQSPTAAPADQSRAPAWSEHSGQSPGQASSPPVSVEPNRAVSPGTKPSSGPKPVLARSVPARPAQQTPDQPQPSRNIAASLFDQPLESPARTPQEKARLLDELNRLHVIPCTKCPELVRNRMQTVFGVGNPATELVLVGEAPGQEEDAQGEPFVGPAGQLLNRILSACGFSRQDVYICNVLKCRPPNNRTPLPHEIANCRNYLEQQLAIIAPKYICCLGAVAAQTLLNTNQSIGKLRGQVHRYRGAALICTYHPAYLLRNPAAKREVWEDMKLLLHTMGRPVPR